MSQPRARIASQLGLALAVILAVVISGSTVFALRTLVSANLATLEEHLASEARQVATSSQRHQRSDFPLITPPGMFRQTSYRE